jgi:hypothetical protein
LRNTEETQKKKFLAKWDLEWQTLNEELLWRRRATLLNGVNTLSTETVQYILNRNTH